MASSQEGGGVIPEGFRGGDKWHPCQNTVSYTDNHGQRIHAYPWWRDADSWVNPVNGVGQCEDRDAPTPADVYAEIAALDETPWDEMGR